MNIVITMVPREGIADVLPYVSNFLKAACAEAYGRTSYEQTVEDLFLANQILWIAFDSDDEDRHIIGCCTIRIVEYPGGKYVSAMIGAGDKGEGEEWIFKMLDVLANFGKDFQCIGTEISGRRGWLRYLSAKDPGYTEVFTLIERKYDGQEGRRRRN